MICPYCQHELDVDSMGCPRCGAEYPRTGGPFGMGIRTAVAAGAMLTVLSLILVDCVINYLPVGNGSPQQTMQAPPNLKSAEVNALLAKWAQHQQNTDLPSPQPLSKGQ
jgi:hypothetical protein